MTPGNNGKNIILAISSHKYDLTSLLHNPAGIIFHCALRSSCCWGKRAYEIMTTTGQSTEEKSQMHCAILHQHIVTAAQNGQGNSRGKIHP